ncbi:pickpocket protein 11-like [Chrysoperla carnea]|uniref:pickpocket protein 11-like n=1 Tax=Chrysoperla carnea TaxID=189513 RepID=UPI001D08A86D|nr:pickpocket protein 11-like [Chrysoperla carnea]
MPTGTMNISTLEMYFKDFTCTKYLRDVYMTWDGLLAAFGGIFGLCMGASLISIAEILFYFCVKYNCYNIFYNNKEKSTASTVRAFTLSERFIKPGELTFQRKIIPDIIIQ